MKENVKEEEEKQQQWDAYQCKASDTLSEISTDVTPTEYL